MNKLLLSLVAIATISLSSFGQAPESFKYQAVIRDAGIILTNQLVGIELVISNGNSSYTETHNVTTNAYGLVNIEIGSGTVIVSPLPGTLLGLSLIDWSAGPYFIKTAVDVTGGTNYAVMGTSQLLSVPYALHANTAENVTNDLVDDADADSTNEMNTGVVLNGTDLEVTDGNGTIVTDLSSLQDGVNDADADPNNEIQTISRTGTTVTLSNGGTFEDSIGVYIAGTGIDITNNVVSATEPTYTIGLWPELGGYVFWVSGDGKHGLVAETQDQGNSNWYEAQNSISNPANHSVNGQKFRDWRMPTKFELNEMYLQQAVIGGFNLDRYWSSTEIVYGFVWRQNFNSGVQNLSNEDDIYYVRSVRAF